MADSRPSPPAPPGPRLPEMKMTEAVTRACAEVMLSVAREAAARILAAERRAAVLEGATAAARDDAVAALLRLKAISDAKIKEAKLQSWAHVNKIQELEMQLCSAQNTISSLEGELKRAHMESNQIRTLSKDNRNCLSTAQKTDGSDMSSYRSKILVRDRSKSPPSSETNCVRRNRMEDENVGKMKNLHSCNNDLASLGITCKESEFYCSRGTKHAHAPEQHSQSVEAPLGRSAGKADQVKSLLIRGKKGIAKKSCSLEAEVRQIANLTYCKRRRSKRSGSTYKHAVNTVQRKIESEAPNASDGNGCMLLLQALEHDLSPMKIFYRQGVNHSAGLMDGLHMARKETSNSCSANSGVRNTFQAKGIQMRKRKRPKNVLQYGGFCSRGALKSSRNPLKEINNNVLSSTKLSSVMVDSHLDDAWGTGVARHPLGKHDTEAMMDLTDPMQSLIDSDNRFLQTIEPVTNETGDEGATEKHSIHLDISSSVKDANPDVINMPVDLSECRTQDDNKSDKDDHICNLDLHKLDTVVSSSTNEENVMISSGTCNQTAGIRCIKYTFNRRKRKSEHIDNNADDSVPEKRIHLIGPVIPESQTPMVLTESPQSKKQLLEIACQLISLSEK
ncbi:hypothetical protein U9M48_032836 [Paspalum notatum var. saurae]|uniref:Uncharacterized protein n=1 Tax=Paspalum notatum var. saurae TaxID=547442 RepID=A0AAQ3U5X1_PASNO